jgi:hypothetical protein
MRKKPLELRAFQHRWKFHVLLLKRRRDVATGPTTTQRRVVSGDFLFQRFFRGECLQDVPRTLKTLSLARIDVW